jgi:hypothetical protein
MPERSKYATTVVGLVAVMFGLLAVWVAAMWVRVGMFYPPLLGLLGVLVLLAVGRAVVVMRRRRMTHRRGLVA